MSIINLLPEDFVKRRFQRRANILCLLLLGAVMLGTAAAIMVSRQSLANTRQVLQRVEDDYTEAAKLLTQLQELDAQKQAIIAKAATTQNLQERVPRSYVLAMVTNALPEYGSLLSLNLEAKQVIARGASKRPQGPSAYVDGAAAPAASGKLVELDIKGLAATDIEVARLIAALARQRIVGSVDLVYSQERVIEQVPMREFNVRVELRPGVDVIDPAAEAPASGEGGEA
jgi:hypothetical protein